VVRPVAAQQVAAQQVAAQQVVAQQVAAQQVVVWDCPAAARPPHPGQVRPARLAAHPDRPAVRQGRVRRAPAAIVQAVLLPVAGHQLAADRSAVAPPQAAVRRQAAADPQAAAQRRAAVQPQVAVQRARRVAAVGPVTRTAPVAAVVNVRRKLAVRAAAAVVAQAATVPVRVQQPATIRSARAQVRPEAVKVAKAATRNSIAHSATSMP
jgi:hypothetical protein